MIRPATTHDFPAIRALLMENDLCVDGLAYDVFTPPCLVAVRDGEVVGVLQALLGKPYAVITELAIARVHQRKGYAVRLMQHMETLLREYGIPAWFTMTSETNDRVRDQLKRYGARDLGHGVGWVKGLA